MNNGYESTGKVIDRKSKPFAVEVYVRPTAAFGKLEMNPNLSKETKNTLEYRVIFKELDLGLDEYVAKISTIQKTKLADEVRKILNESGLSDKPIRVVETSLDSVTNVISNTSELNMNNTYIVSSEGMSVGNKDIINYLDVI